MVQLFRWGLQNMHDEGGEVVKKTSLVDRQRDRDRVTMLANTMEEVRKAMVL